MTSVLENVLSKSRKTEEIKNYFLDTSDYDEDLINQSLKKKYIAYDYISNGMSGEEILKKYNLSNLTSVDYYKDLVIAHGYDVFDEILSVEKISLENKLNMMNEIVEEGQKIRRVAIKYKVLNYSTLRKWVEKYKRDGIKALYTSNITK